MFRIILSSLVARVSSLYYGYKSMAKIVKCNKDGMEARVAGHAQELAEANEELLSERDKRK
jgi:hypothetical protein